MTAFLLMAALVIVTGTAGCGGGGDDTPPTTRQPVITKIAPGQGIQIQQVDFDFPGGAEIGSTWGRLVVDSTALSRSAGVQEGYISLMTDKGWAVPNVPVPPPGQPPHVIYFDIGLPGPSVIDQTQVDLKHSDIAVKDMRIYRGEALPFSVEPWVWDAHGLGPDSKDVRPPEIPPYTIAWNDLPIVAALSSSTYQAITNVQCAYNQCFPMATANSLQFLEDSGAITLPNDHSQGLGLAGYAESNTLVGQLDLFAERSVTSRTSGNGVWFEPMIDGTFEYLADISEVGTLSFRHVDEGYGDIVPEGNYAHAGSTSVDDGPTVGWNWINARVSDGCGIVMVFQPHAVRITGAGRSLGLPWIRYSHDANQLDDTTGLENVITFLSDSDGDGKLNMGGSSLEVEWVWAICP